MSMGRTTVEHRDSPRAPTALKVVVLSGPDAGAEVALNDAVSIGSDAANNLVLRDRSVSRKHLQLTPSGARVLIRDLGSRNGTFIAGTRIQEVEVAVGAVLSLGDTTLGLQPRWHTREIAPSTANGFGELSGESLPMREVYAILERVAATDVTVLIEGESGTGKELAARSIHQASLRARGPYEVFDCGSVPSDLAESELFGHKKGAFSGAVADRTGAFVRAHSGTICLDELGELPLDLQPKLLRVLETGDVRPVGSDTSKKVDVRLIASTNRDLQAEVKRGRFRADLLYRLEVVKLRMPPLRQRLEDIPRLVERLLRDALASGDRVTGSNLDLLMGYPWPGNVRELRNVLLRAVTLGKSPGETHVSFQKLVFNLGTSTTTPTMLGSEFPGVGFPMEFKDAKAQLLAAFERAYVTSLLKRCQGNMTRAAELAGLSRKHLYELLKRAEANVDPLDE